MGNTCYMNSVLQVEPNTLRASSAVAVCSAYFKLLKSLKKSNPAALDLPKPRL